MWKGEGLDPYPPYPLSANVELLRGIHPEDRSARIRDAMQSSAKRASAYGNWQFRMLVTGAVLYIVWHVIGMWLRTTATPLSLGCE
jgi:hypothetical protein